MNEERLNEQTDREDQGQDISAREARRQELMVLPRLSVFHIP